MNERKKMLGSISSVMIITIISRLLSLLSTQIYMSFYGLNNFLNIYSYAITIPNTIFCCLGTALSAVVIPIYAGYLARNNRVKADSFANNVITISTVFTLLLVIIGIVISPFVVKLTSFTDPNEYNFAVKSLMVMMPVMLFYGLNYIFQGLLQSNGKYVWPAFVSVPSSLVVIVYVFLLGDRYGITGLLFATLIGLSMQAIILIPPLIKCGYRYKPRFSLKDDDIKNAKKTVLNTLIGVSAYQINTFCSITLVSRIEGMITIFTYTQNIVVQMILSIVYSIIAVLYPKLANRAAVEDIKGYKKSLNEILSNIMFLLVPISIGFIVVREPLLQLIANWGKVTNQDIQKAAIMIIMYSIGIVGIGLKEILDRAFYAIKDTKTPALAGFVIMVANIILGLMLMNIIGVYGICLAYSISSIIGTIMLILCLTKRIGKFLTGFFISFFKSFIAAIIMGICVLKISDLIDLFFFGDGLIERVMMLIIPVVIGVVVYGIMLFILKVDIAVIFVKKFLKIKKES